MSRLSIFLLVFAMGLGTLPTHRAQEPANLKQECGTVVTEAQIGAEIARRDRFTQPRQLAPYLARPYHIPLSIHIVRMTDGTGGFTLNQLDLAMKHLNQMWEPVGIQFFQRGLGYINSDYFFDLPAADQTRRDELRQVSPVANTINVYFTNLNGPCGQSSYTTDSVQGVLIDNGCAGTGSNPSTFAHEIGHYFDLYHTHETVFGVDCPSGSICSFAGDLLCDTPADPNLTDRVDSSCIYDNSASTPSGCGTTAYAPATRNLMSYSTKPCRNQFTSGQNSKALDTLENDRSNLITSGMKYVASNASPLNTACTYQAPCQTVAKGVTAAIPGDHIFILSGSYPAVLSVNKAVFLKKWDSGVTPATIGQ